MDATNLLIWRDFERTMKLLNRSERTIQSYREAVEQLLAHHPGAHLDEITKEQVRDYLLWVLANHKDTTAGVRYRSLRRVFNWMAEEDIIGESPMRKLGEPKPEDKPTEIPPVDHVRALLKVCAGKDHDALRDTAIIRVFCEPGGPRVAEMAGIQLEHVDLTQDVIAIHGKGNKWRAVPFGAKTGKALTRYMRQRAKHELRQLPHLWLGSRGKALTSSGIYQMLERRCVEAEIPRIHPHQLRHFAVDVWYEHGGSEQDAMRLFGWSSPAMAHHYAAAHGRKRAVQGARDKGLGDLL